MLAIYCCVNSFRNDDKLETNIMILPFSPFSVVVVFLLLLYEGDGRGVRNVLVYSNNDKG